jgi:hypothetical protein
VPGFLAGRHLADLVVGEDVEPLFPS